MSKFTPDTTIKQLLELHFAHILSAPKAKPKATDNCRWIIRTVVKRIAQVIGEEPRIQHLTDDIYQQILAFHKIEPTGRKTKFTAVRDYFRCCRRRAVSMGVLPLPESPPDVITTKRGPKLKFVLSDAPGTLWHLCIKRYFPTNLAIRHQHTKNQYVFALRNFKEFLGRDATLEDLNEDAVLGMMAMLRDKSKLAPKTINERRGRLVAIWNWAAKKRLVEQFPCIGKIKEPRRTPRAWTRDQLLSLFTACKTQPGYYLGVSAADWWLALHLVLWDSGERIGALLAAEWSWLDLESGILSVPYHARKGSDQDMVYSLHTDTLAVLRTIAEPERKLIFPFPSAYGYFYIKYKRLLEDAGLPTGRSFGPHRMRRSVASYIQAAGHDASAVLHHSSPDITRKSYIDPGIVGASRPSEILFRPGQAK